MVSTLYKGIIVQVLSSFQYKVWLVSKGNVPLGKWEYLGGNVGSNLLGENVRKSIWTCRIMTPLASGAWWTYIPSEDASIPGNPPTASSSDILDFTTCPDAKSINTSVAGSLISPSSTPHLTLNVVHPVLGQAGGIPIPTTANVPPGTFPRLKENQHVLVAFVNASTPIIIGTLPTDLELQATLG